MVKALYTVSRGNIAADGITVASTTHNWLAGVGPLELNVTELRRQTTWRSAGTVSKLYVRIIANSTTASSTISSRKNAAAGAMTITIPAGTTGVFEDTTNTDTIAAGDEYNLRSVTGAGGTLTIGALSVIFNATTNCVSKLISRGMSISAASTTNYILISGTKSNALDTVEANAQAKVQIAGTAKNAFLYISTNARTTSTTWTLRKNGVDTGLVLSAAAGVTGFIEDTSNTVSVAAGDLLCWKQVTAAGTETLTYFSLCFDYETTTNNGFLNYSGEFTGELTVGPATTEYYTIGGGMIEGLNTEPEAQIKARERFILKGLTVYVRANTISADSTLRLRKNGANTNQSISIPNATTGYFTVASTAQDTFDPTDEMSLQVVTGASGTTLTITQIGIWTDTVAAVVKTASDSTVIAEASMLKLAAKKRTRTETATIAENVVRQKSGAAVNILKDLNDTTTIGETRARLKASWRQQP